MQENTKSWVGYVAGIISGITYGLNPLFGVPVVNQGVSVSSLLLYRYSIAILFLALFMLLRRQSFRVSRRQGFTMALLGAFFTMCSVSLFAAYRYIPSGIATTILYVYPIVVALIMVFLKEYPTWQTWISILTGVVGAAFLSFSGEGGFLDIRGVVLVMVSAISYSAFIVIVNRSQEVKKLNNITLTFYNFLFGSIILFIITVFRMDFQALPSVSCWFNVVGLAVIPTAIATISLTVASKRIGATKASVLGILEPLTAIFVGTVVFHEAFTLNIGIGVALIVFAILFMVLTSKTKSNG
jgi:Predicted permease, DMT superfamily